MWRKPSGSKDRIINKLLLDPHMASTLRFEPGPHWWEATALTTALLFFQATKSGGTLVVVGMGKPEVKFPIVDALVREVDIRGIFRYVNW